MRGTPGFKSAFHYDPVIALGLKRLWYLLDANASDLEIEEKLHQEIAAIGSVCREAGLGLHMDGARFANALAALGCSPRLR